MCKRTFFVAAGLLAAVACMDPTGPPSLEDGSCDEIAVLGQMAGSNGGDLESYNAVGGNYDGDVDSVDSYLEENHLRLGERTPQESTSVGLQSQARWSRWSPGDAEKSTKQNDLGSCGAKFSDTAVSW